MAVALIEVVELAGEAGETGVLGTLSLRALAVRLEVVATRTGVSSGLAVGGLRASGWKSGTDEVGEAKGEEAAEEYCCNCCCCRVRKGWRSRRAAAGLMAVGFTPVGGAWLKGVGVDTRVS